MKDIHVLCKKIYNGSVLVMAQGWNYSRVERWFLLKFPFKETVCHTCTGI